MSFAEKVHSRLLALESQVQALDKRLKALEVPALSGVNEDVMDSVEYAEFVAKQVHEPIKRKPGRPKKVANA